MSSAAAHVFSFFSLLSLSQITLCAILLPQTSSKSFLSLVFSLLYPLFFAGEADNLLRRSWTTGLGVGVQDSGGLIQQGGMLASACRVIQDTLLTKTHTIEQWVDFDVFVGNLSLCVSVSLSASPPLSLFQSLSLPVTLFS